MNHEKLKKTAAISAVVILSASALDACIGYDNDVNPSLGEVTAHSEPRKICSLIGKVYSCRWKYWLYIDGCAELPKELVEEAKSKDEDWRPQKGWVDVSGNTWANTPDGEIIHFNERNFMNSVTLLGLDKDKPVDC